MLPEFEESLAKLQTSTLTQNHKDIVNNPTQTQTKNKCDTFSKWSKKINSDLLDDATS